MQPEHLWVTECPDRMKWGEKVAQLSIEAPGGCHIWLGTLDRNGYGVFTYRNGPKTWRTGAHRAAYLAFAGSIPRGLVIDHLCRQPRCVNPLHLDPVTSRVNTQRAAELGVMKGTTGRKVGMIYGCRTHGKSDGYVRPTKRKNGMGTEWACRPCLRASWNRSMARKREREAAEAT